MKIADLFNFLLNKNFLTTILNNLSKLIRGPITAFFILSYLNPEEQGYWYAFQSLLVFVAIGELGFSKLVTLKVAEYSAKLQGNRKKLTFKSDFTELCSFIFINYFLYFFIAVLSVICLYLSVLYFFSSWTAELYFAFFLSLLFSSFSLFNTLQGSIFYGLNLVYLKNIQEFVFGITFSSSLVVFLYLGLGIYALAWSILIGNVVCHVVLIRYYIKWIKRMLGYVDVSLGLRLLKDLKSLQLKYGLVTLMSLYITNTIVPFAIKYFNPVIAGQIGFSYFVISSLVLVAWTFFYIQYPRVLQLIAQNRLDEVYKESRKYLIQINISLLLLLFSFFISIDFITINVIDIKTRMLPNSNMYLISLSQIVLLNIGFFAALVRGFHVEPYWKLSFLQIILTTGLYIIAALTNSISLFFKLDALLHVGVLLPFSIFLGKNKLKEIYVSK